MKTKTTKTTQLGPNWKTYDQMNNWEKMEHRLGLHLVGVKLNGKIWWKMNK